MLTRPPITTAVSNHSTQTEGNRQGAIRTDSVVLAADGLLRAGGVSTDTNDSNGAAVEAELASHTLGVDAKHTEHGEARSRIGLREKRREHSA